MSDLAVDDNAPEPVGSAPTVGARWLPPVVAGVLCTITMLLGWRGVDWPAQLYRVQLFKHHGWLAFDTGWYGGHYPLAYSALFPPLAATVGVTGAAIGCAMVAAWAFDRLVWGEFGPRARIGSLLFATGTVVQVDVGQLPFLLGLTFGLLAVLAARRSRGKLAVLAAVACPLASPVAAAFLVLVAAAWAVTTGRSQRHRPALLAAAAIVPALIVAVLYHQSGPFPFPAGGLMLLLLACAGAQFLLPRRERGLRVGAAFYALAALLSFVIPSPMGGNISRLGTTLAVPLLAATVIPARRVLGALLAVPLLAWQWTPAFGAAMQSHDPAEASSYSAPLIEELAKLQTGPARLEIPFTREHWEVARVAPVMPLARGWYRQLDISDNGLFYQPGGVTDATYQSWLYDNGIAWVALPDVPLDYSSETEAALLRRGTDYLQPVWHNAHWQLWSVEGSPGLATGPARLTSLQAASFSLATTDTGPVVVRVRYTANWRVDQGTACLTPTPQGWTQVRVQQPGTVRVVAGLLPSGNSSC